MKTATRYLVAVALLLLPVPPGAVRGETPGSPHHSYRLVNEWGEAGDGPGQFAGLQGLAVDAGGRVYVADADNCRIQVFDPEGTFLRTWGACGDDDPAGLEKPTDVAVSPSAEIVVVDFFRDRVQVYSPQGELLRGWGGSGSAPGELSSPVGVTVDERGRIHVSEFYGHRVQIFSPRGESLGIWGGDGDAPGQLHYPSKLTSAGEDLWIADTHNGRLQRLTLEGDPLATVGSAGTWFGQFRDAMDLAVTPEGSLHVADAGNFRVQWLTAEGDFLAQWQLDRPEAASFKAPQGIASAGDGRLYVTDPANHRIYELEAREDTKPRKTKPGNEETGSESPPERRDAQKGETP